MKKVFLLTMALMLLSLAGFSQTSEEPTYEFKRHAYLRVQGGGAYTLGEAPFKDLISPAAALSLGYQFSPVLGVRLGATGWQAKGAWVSPKQLYKFNYAEASLDLTLDLGSLLGGYNPMRVVNPYLFLGGGGAYAFNNDEANALNTGGYKLEYLWNDSKIFPMGRVGLGVDFRLSDAISLNLEGNVNVTNDHFNSKKADQPDWQFNALVGLKFNLGKSYTKVVPAYVEEVPVVEPTPVVEATPEPEPAPAPVVKEFPALPAIHFAFDSDVVDTDKYAAELATIVSVLKEFDDVNVDVVGYTDHKGSDAYNDKLSVRRAEAVKRYLVEQGISESRLSTSGLGKDPKTSGQEALTIQARRVEVAK